MNDNRPLPRPPMPPSADEPAPPRPMGLTALRRQIALLEKAPPAGFGTAENRALTWGLGAIDGHLPGGGLALGSLHEFAGDGPDLEEASLAAAALTRLIGRRQQQSDSGSVLWISRSRDLYARALPEQGFDPNRLMHLRVRCNDDALWALEEGLRCTGLVAAVAELAALDLTQSRRLQLAAEKSGVPALVIRRGDRADALRQSSRQPIAAHTRWRIGPLPSFGVEAAPHPMLPGPARWQIELWRCRGGRPATWLVEEHEDGWREAAFPQPVSAPLADRLLASPAKAAGETADAARRKRAQG